MRPRFGRRARPPATRLSTTCVRRVARGQDKTKRGGGGMGGKKNNFSRKKKKKISVSAPNERVYPYGSVYTRGLRTANVFHIIFKYSLPLDGNHVGIYTNRTAGTRYNHGRRS